MLGGVGDGGGFGRRVIARQGQHTAARRGAGAIGVAQHIARAIHPRPLAIPDGKDALLLRALIKPQLLRAPAGGGGEILIQPGLEDDAGLGQALSVVGEFAVIAPQRRATIAGDIPRRVPAQRLIHLPAQEGQAHQGLGAGEQGFLAR